MELNLSWFDLSYFGEKQVCQIWINFEFWNIFNFSESSHKKGFWIKKCTSTNMNNEIEQIC